MATKKSTKKKSAKTTAKKGSTKKSAKRTSLFEDPPIIVGGGNSEIIKIRADLSVAAMLPAGGYNRLRVGGVNIRFVDVDGSSHGVDPVSNKVRFLEHAPIKRRK